MDGGWKDGWRERERERERKTEKKMRLSGYSPMSGSFIVLIIYGNKSLPYTNHKAASLLCINVSFLNEICKSQGTGASPVAPSVMREKKPVYPAVVLRL